MVAGIIRATLPCMGRGVVLETGDSLSGVSLSAGILRKKINLTGRKQNFMLRYGIS